MRIAVIGAGGIGTALCSLFKRHEHEVFVGSRSGPMSYREAALAAEIVFFCIPWEHHGAAVAALGDIGGRVLVDVSNPESLDGRALALGHSTSGAETIAAEIPSARVVKAFNYVYAELLADPAAPARVAPSIFYCGDDGDAKQKVRALIESCSLDAIDCGSLLNARYLEPLAMLMVQLVRQQGWPPDGVAMRLAKASSADRVQRSGTPPSDRA